MAGLLISVFFAAANALPLTSDTVNLLYSMVEPVVFPLAAALAISFASPRGLTLRGMIWGLVLGVVFMASQLGLSWLSVLLMSATPVAVLTSAERAEGMVWLIWSSVHLAAAVLVLVLAVLWVLKAQGVSRVRRVLVAGLLVLGLVFTVASHLYFRELEARALSGFETGPFGEELGGPNGYQSLMDIPLGLALPFGLGVATGAVWVARDAKTARVGKVIVVWTAVLYFAIWAATFSNPDKLLLAAAGALVGTAWMIIGKVGSRWTESLDFWETLLVPSAVLLALKFADGWSLRNRVVSLLAGFVIPLALRYTVKAIRGRYAATEQGGDPAFEARP